MFTCQHTKFTTIAQSPIGLVLGRQTDSGSRHPAGIGRRPTLNLGALLVTLLDFPVIFAIMAAFTGAAALCLLVSLRGRLFRPDSRPTATPAPAVDRSTPLSEPSVSAFKRPVAAVGDTLGS